MSYLIFILVIGLLVLAAVIITFDPHFEIVQTGINQFKVIVYYNHFEGPEIHRRNIILFEVK